MRTKTRRRHTIKLIRDVLAPNLGLVFRILIDCIICVSSSFSFRNLSIKINSPVIFGQANIDINRTFDIPGFMCIIFY